jgi:hypothetical protein
MVLLLRVFLFDIFVFLCFRLNDEIQTEVCCPSGKEIPQCDSESIEITDMLDLLLKVLKSEFEKDSYRSSPLLEYSASFCWIPYQVCKLNHH